MLSACLLNLKSSPREKSDSIAETLNIKGAVGLEQRDALPRTIPSEHEG